MTAIKSRGTKKASSDKTSAKSTRRTKPRVEDTEPKLHTASAQLSTKQSPKVHAVANVIDGELLVSGVLAETVPVAQYANVVLGPVGLQWKLGGIDMSVLTDVEWGDIDEGGESTFDYDALTPEQKAVYDKARGAVRATMKIIEHAVAEDRETVERSVRMHNEREAAEAADATKAKAKSRARR